MLWEREPQASVSTAFSGSQKLSRDECFCNSKLNNSIEELTTKFSYELNTVASRDRFKPIRIGENLVVNFLFLLENAATRKRKATCSLVIKM